MTAALLSRLQGPDQPANGARPDDGPQTAITGLLKTTGVGSVLLVAGLLAASFLPIDGAVITQGQILMAGKPQPMQSLEPGVVAEVRIHEGDQVAAGQVLMRLDPTHAQAQLAIATERLAQSLAEQARFLAEAKGMEQPDFTPPPLPFAAPDLSQAAARQNALFETRQRQRSEARNQLAETDAQLLAQIDGLRAQQAAGREQERLLNEDMARQQALVSQGLAREAPLNELRREGAALAGQIANLSAEIARVEGSRRAAALELAQEESRRSEAVAQGLRDSATLVQELSAEIVSLQAVLARTELRAPVAGTVHELTAPAPGSVVSAGMVLAQIVPTGQALEIEVAVDPRNIDSLHEGQSAEVMLSAFDPRSVPKLPAMVQRIPPGAVTNPETGQSFYRVMLELAPGALPEGLALRSGMPVQAFIATGERSLLSWLLAPLTRPLASALRED